MGFSRSCPSTTQVNHPPCEKKLEQTGESFMWTSKTFCGWLYAVNICAIRAAQSKGLLCVGITQVFRVCESLKVMLLTM
jgi:hypothetical protein